MRRERVSGNREREGVTVQMSQESIGKREEKKNEVNDEDNIDSSGEVTHSLDTVDVMK